MLKDLLIIVAGAFAFSALTATGLYFTASAGCKASADMMRLEHSYGMLTGCMIKVNGTWIPGRAYRLVAE